MMIDVAEKRLMRQTAEDLVVRARVGDQNAIAIIEMTRDNAARGMERAAIAYCMIKKSLERVPILVAGTLPIPKRRSPRVEYSFASAVFAGEPDEEYGKTIVAYAPNLGALGIILLANGPSLTMTGRARQIAQTFKSSEEKNAFCLARRGAGCANMVERAQFPKDLQRAMAVGDSFGLAQKLQTLRKPGARMSDWDPRLGWEFGE
jgi:hypothetical protein